MNIGPPPFVPHDVACPVLLDDGKPTLRPYVVAGACDTVPPGTKQPRFTIPDHLVVLIAGPTRGMYVHLDPRQVVFKRDELIRTGAIESDQWEAWLYDRDEDATFPGELLFALFPNTGDRFYFNLLRVRVEAKAYQITNTQFSRAEWYCHSDCAVIVPYRRGKHLQ